MKPKSILIVHECSTGTVRRQYATRPVQEFGDSGIMMPYSILGAGEERSTNQWQSLAGLKGLLTRSGGQRGVCIRINVPPLPLASTLHFPNV